MSKLYLAYGSNLNLLQMAYRCPKANMVGSTILTNHRLVYKGYSDKHSFLTIEPCVGKIVPLGIFEIGLIDRLKLDKYEGYPSLYHIEKKEILLNDEQLTGMIYVMNDGYEYKIPSKSYINVCKQGYLDFDFDINILEEALNYTKEKIKEKR